MQVPPPRPSHCTPWEVWSLPATREAPSCRRLYLQQGQCNHGATFTALLPRKRKGCSPSSSSSSCIIIITIAPSSSRPSRVPFAYAFQIGPPSPLRQRRVLREPCTSILAPQPPRREQQQRVPPCSHSILHQTSGTLIALARVSVPAPSRPRACCAVRLPRRRASVRGTIPWGGRLARRRAL